LSVGEFVSAAAAAAAAAMSEDADSVANVARCDDVRPLSRTNVKRLVG